MKKYSFVFMDDVVRSFTGRLTADDDTFYVNDGNGLTYVIPTANVRFYTYA